MLRFVGNSGGGGGDGIYGCGKASLECDVISDGFGFTSVFIVLTPPPPQIPLLLILFAFSVFLLRSHIKIWSFPLILWWQRRRHADSAPLPPTAPETKWKIQATSFHSAMRKKFCLRFYLFRTILCLSSLIYSSFYRSTRARSETSRPWHWRGAGKRFLVLLHALQKNFLPNCLVSEKLLEASIRVVCRSSLKGPGSSSAIRVVSLGSVVIFRCRFVSIAKLRGRPSP